MVTVDPSKLISVLTFLRIRSKYPVFISKPFDEKTPPSNINKLSISTSPFS